MDNTKLKPGLCHKCGKLVMIRPYCSRHRRKKLGLRLGTSTIPNAGLGVFSLRQFKAGDLVCRYYSEYLTQSQYKRRYKLKELAKYALEFKHGEFVDGSKHRGIDMMINHAENGDPRCNVDFAEDGIRAKLEIQPGDELLVDYGPDYWD